ncbi:MAG: DUF6198 family protein [Oscillospiraceae bacterium]|jgi:uncharacterized membrane protein YczE|nr:DUF6198 family protein [Oscillospiraceae bacterium]
MKEKKLALPPPKQIAFRLLFYIGGQLLIAFGVRAAIMGGLGISPVSSPSRAIFHALSFHNLTMNGLITYGVCYTGVFLLYIILQILLLRRDFKVIHLFQMLVAMLFGFMIDFAGWCLDGLPAPRYYAMRLLLLAISILLIALGVSFYMGSRLLPMPSEGIVQALAQKLKKYPFHRVKLGIDCGLVITATLIVLIFTGKLTDVREGTFFTALCVGPVMGLLRPVIGPMMRRLCFGEQKGGQTI